jgi:hypothetical protein
MNAEPAPARRLASRVLVGIAVCVLGYLLICAPHPLPAEHLDTSWQTVLGHDLLEGRQFGSETVFTAGPLGYFLVTIPPYVRGLYAATLLVSFLLGLGAAAILLAAARGQPWTVRILLAAAIALVAPLQREIVHFAALAAVPVALAAAARPRLPWIALGAVWVAAVALAKHTLMIAAAVAVVASIVALVSRRGVLVAIAALLLQAAALAAVWLAARQDLRGFPAFLEAGWESVRSYAENMGLVEKGVRLEPPIAAALALAIACCAALAARIRKRTDLAGGAAVAAVLAVTAIVHRLGMLRADHGHQMIPNGTLMLAALVLPASPSRTAEVFRGIAFAAGLAGIFVSPLGIPVEQAAAVLGHRVVRVAHALEGRELPAFEREVEAQRAASPIRDLAKKIGTTPVDLLGWSQGVLHLHDLQVRHRPVFQDYAAQSPELEERNAAFFRGGGAPPLVLARIAPIDGRFPTISDSATIRALLDAYRPAGEEGGYALFERDAAGAPAARVPGLTVAARLGGTVELPAIPEGLTEVAIEVRPSVSGRVRSAVGRPASLWILVTLADGTEQWFRISRLLASSPFVLDPFVDSTQALVGLWGHRRVVRVKSFRVEAEVGREACFDPEIRVTLWSNDALWSRLRETR